MKDFMIVVNMVIVVASIASIIWHLIIGQFGTAWLCVIPLLYGWWNVSAITEE